MRRPAKILLTSLSLLTLSFSLSNTLHGEGAKRFQKFEGYIGTGIASWVGAKFHGKKTASGRLFNMYERVSAHKAYRLGLKPKLLT